MFNSDGSLGKTCGNALRCVGKYLSMKYTDRTTFSVKTSAAVSVVAVTDDGITASLSKPEFVGRKNGAYFVNVGNPHAVILTENLSDSAFSEAMETTRIYDVNTEMVKLESENTFKMRVCERGSGVRRMSFGSGVVPDDGSIKRRQVENRYKFRRRFVDYGRR